MTPSLPAGSPSFRDSRPRAAVHQRPSGRSRPTRIDPIDHHVAGHQAEHSDKPGRPRRDRNHTTP
jgi:hypothetical protein